ncbi:MAG: hypothetical protein GY762_02565 [Proteobacteria bacterium]|nr:hypothetical protein [Pseudomonadota bacterium]
MEISGKTKLFSIIGAPVAGVVSPPAINAWFEARDMDVKMVPLNIPLEGIDTFWDVLRVSETFLGCSVTYPHKQSAYAAAKIRTDRATRLGALNTLRRNPDGSLSGDATDGLALVHAILAKGGTLNGRSAHVIGAGGGAGRAIIDAFCEAGISRLIVEDSDQMRRAETVSLIAEYWSNVSISQKHVADILVDATSNGQSATAKSLFSDDAISGCKIVCDIAGNIAISQFLINAERMGKTLVEASDMGHEQVEVQMEFLLQKERP